MRQDFSNQVACGSGRARQRRKRLVVPKPQGIALAFRNGNGEIGIFHASLNQIDALLCQLSLITDGLELMEFLPCSRGQYSAFLEILKADKSHGYWFNSTKRVKAFVASWEPEDTDTDDD